MTYHIQKVQTLIVSAHNKGVAQYSNSEPEAGYGYHYIS